MERVFVTLFDYNYLSRGLTLYDSLIRTCENFRLYIVCFDNASYFFLLNLNLVNATVISLDEFEDEDLLSVKNHRSTAEYCWTSTPKTIKYIFDHFNERICTYVDSDIFMFDDPAVLLDEIPDDKSVMITEHRYSDYCDMSDTAGIYNVQFMTFKNNDEAKKVLYWWVDKCIENCCVDQKRGLCGDQKYLDDWKDRFSCVYVMKNEAGGIAPWNSDQYSFSIMDNSLVYRKGNSAWTKVVFFHFHALSFYDNGVVALSYGDYRINDTAVAYVYKTYLRAHEESMQKYALDMQAINLKHFRDNNVDHLVKDRNYYLLDLFK